MADDRVEFEDVASELEDRQASPPSYEIATYPADFTLDGLYLKWQDEDIVIPKFQRGYVWTQVQASKLIESFLVGLPVPGIFFYTDRSSEKFLVVDGQQRLRTAFFFFEGLFGEERSTGSRVVFRLKGLNDDSPYAGKTFDELDDASKRRLKNSVLRAFVIRQLDPQDDTSVFHIFERLNTGGTLLHNQEVRNAISSGTFNELLQELNDIAEWRLLLGKPEPDGRMRDVELILRFFSLKHANAVYEKPMKDFMSRYMRTHAHASAGQIDGYREEFSRTVSAVHASLGDRPFHLRAGLNSSVFDAVSIAFSRNLDAIPTDILTRYQAMTVSDDFTDLVSSGTTDVEQVRRRLALAEQRLFGT